MLTKEDNELLCRIGPGTPMGNLMRQYWLPAIRSDELPEPGCPPLRTKLMGEELIGFRGTDGNVGLINNKCPHRGASLFFGITEDCGLRCVYHGWKFDVNGNCVDMPSEPPESNFSDKVNIKSYPCQERNGIIWAYLGPRKVPPPLPELEANMEPNYNITVLHRANNWLQGIEGEMDTIHASFLHLGSMKVEDTEPGSLFYYYQALSRHGKFSVRKTDYGTAYGMYRPAEENTDYWRIGHILFPTFAMVPGIRNALGEETNFIAYIPMDDEHTLEWNVSLRDPDAPPRNTDRDYLPNTTDWYGRFNLTQDYGNDFLIDRELQQSGESYTGIKGIRQQDMAMTEGMGPILDRTDEHLGTTDQMIIRTRSRWLAAVRGHMEDGTVPPGVDQPELYHQRGGQIILPRDADWWEETKDLRENFRSKSVEV